MGDLERYRVWPVPLMLVSACAFGTATPELRYALGQECGPLSDNRFTGADMGCTAQSTNVTRLLQQSLLPAGDIRDWSIACNYYMCARWIAPRNAKSYNQLAVISSIRVCARPHHHHPPTPLSDPPYW